MAPPRTWLVIPAIAIACAGLALATGQVPYVALAIGGLAAAIAAAVRAYAGSSFAAAIAAGSAAVLGSLGLLEECFPIARAALAAAAAMFAIAELARLLPAKSPFPAIGASFVAAILDPSFVGLIAIAGSQFLIGPWSRPRWAAAVPIAGALAIVLALVAAAFHHGPLARLWLAWIGHSLHSASPAHVIAFAGDALGPLTVVAAVVGLAVCIARGHIAAAAIVAVTAGAIAVDLRDGALGPATLAIAALASGAGIHRLAAMVRWSAGQALVGATASFIMLVAPVLALVQIK